MRSRFSRLPPRSGRRTGREERLGTRWAVWVGGLALALGGLLLVRYSIEQGVFGPGVRIALGALFSLALVAAGEWFRRTERVLPVEAISRRARAEHPHRRRHRECLRHRLRRARALRVHRPGRGLRPARHHRRRHHAGRARCTGRRWRASGWRARWSCRCSSPRRRRAPGRWCIYLVAVAAAAYALARLRRWLWLAVAAVVAGVFLWGLALLGQINTGIAGDGRRRCSCTSPCNWRSRPRSSRSSRICHRRRRGSARLDRLGRAGVTCRCSRCWLGAGRFDTQWTVFAIAAMAILALTSWRSAPPPRLPSWPAIVSLGAIWAWPGRRPIPSRACSLPPWPRC